MNAEKKQYFDFYVVRLQIQWLSETGGISCPIFFNLNKTFKNL